MEIIKKIIEEAPYYLNSNGQLWIEHEPEQCLEIKKIAGSTFLVTTHKDQYDVLRYTQLVLQ